MPFNGGGSGGGGGTWGTISGVISAQTDLNTALGLKAATSSLATVATTGAYSDLTGKPTLGSAAAQATSAFDAAGAAAAITLAGLGGVATSITVGGHPLSGNVTLAMADITKGQFALAMACLVLAK